MLENTAFQQGSNAATAGHNAADCPFPTGVERKDWLNGFFSVKKPEPIQHRDSSGSKPK